MRPLAALAAALLLARCLSTGMLSSDPWRSIPDPWRSVPQAAPAGSVSFDGEGKLRTSPEPQPPMLADGPIRFAGTRIFNQDKPLTDAFPAVDSLDFSESRGEVIFSAIGVRGLDIGLVSSDGSPVNWVPQDPADEVAPQWAPLGNKASFVVRARAGDLVRTVHIPTAAQLSVVFPNSRIHARAWDAQGQFFAVAWSSPDASDRVEVMKYGGEERSLAVPPAVQLDVDVEPFAPGAVLLRPRDVRYDEKLPLVIWHAADLRWNDARGALLRNARAACIVTTGAVPDLAARVRETPWLDAGRVFVVHAGRRGEEIDGAIAFAPDPAAPAGRWQRRADLVTAAPAAIQSLAAGFIADQLKRISPTNGSSR